MRVRPFLLTLLLPIGFALCGCRNQPRQEAGLATEVHRPQQDTTGSAVTSVATYNDNAYNDTYTDNTDTDPTSSGDPSRSCIACRLDSLGFVNIAEADSTIAIDLIYTRADNFTGEVLYEELKEAYLHPDAMKSLTKAQRLLKERHPGYSLIVYDAARPLSVQQKMWDTVKGTSRSIYVSNPKHGGGLHNYGLAVDVSILDAEGTPLPMGTPVDHLGKEAHITDEAALVAQGKITEQARKNRLLLRQVMKEAGFRPLPGEWWHFNRIGRQTAKEKYRVIP